MSVPNFHALASNAPSSLPGPAVTFADLKRALLNHWQIFALTVLAIVALVTVYVFRLPNTYTSVCAVKVERNLLGEIKLEKDSQGTKDSSLSTSEFIRTQEKVLKSRILAERVIKRLDLIKNTDFNPDLQPRNLYGIVFKYFRSLFLGEEDSSEFASDPNDSLNPPVSPEIEPLIKEYYLLVEISPVRATQIIEIKAKSTSRILSVRLANAHAQEFISFALEQRFVQASKSADFLQKEADKLKDRLAISESKLQDYRELTSLATTPESEEKVLENLRAQLATARSQLAQYEERYLEKHPKLMAAVSAVSKLEKETRERENSIMAIRSKSVGYESLNRQIEADRILYKNVLEKLKELNIQSSVATTNITIVDQATMAKEKSGPSRVKTIALSAIAAMLLATGLSLGLELTNQTLRTPEDIAATLASPFLGYIPHCKSQSAGLKLLAKDQEVDRALMESYRTIQAVLRYQPESSDARVILLTSACPDEGKTYNAVHFARSFAEIGFRTLLIEADLRRPSIPRITGLSETPSLIAACSPDVTGEPDLMAISQKTSIPKLRVIVAGGSTLASPEILAGNRFREILALARKTFDRIVIDTPPLGALGDSLGLSTMVDGVIWVTRFGKVKKRIVKTAFERLSQIKAKVLGVVLNDLDRKRLGSSYYYDYNRYGGDYYNTEKKSPKPRTSNNQQPITHNQPPITSQPPTTHNQPPPNNQQAKVTILRPPPKEVSPPTS